MTPCDAVDFLVYEGTTLRKFPSSDVYFYVTERMAIDADGAELMFNPQSVLCGWLQSVRPLAGSMSTI